MSRCAVCRNDFFQSQLEFNLCEKCKKIKDVKKRLDDLSSTLPYSIVGAIMISELSDSGTSSSDSSSSFDSGGGSSGGGGSDGSF